MRQQLLPSNAPSCVQLRPRQRAPAPCSSSTSSCTSSTSTTTTTSCSSTTRCSTSITSSSSTRCSCTTSSTTSATSIRRRRLLLRSILVPPLLLIGSDDATTIVNSVLSAYGLPTLAASRGFRAYDEALAPYSFEFPRSWVIRANSMRPGVVASDYQTADKVSVEELDVPVDGDISAAAVAAAVTPGGGRLTQDDVLSLPAARLVKSATAELDGQTYLYLSFPSETLTRSGYNIKRRNFVAAAVRRGRLYVLAVSARSDQYDEQKRELLQHVLESFRLR